MCTYSMIMDSIMPQRIPIDTWTPQAWDRLQEILEQVKKLDAALGQKDCVDPEKEKILERIEEHVKSIDARVRKLERKPKRKAAKRRR